jgi:hypothetical protein
MTLNGLRTMGPIGRSPDRISRRWGPDNIPVKGAGDADTAAADCSVLEVTPASGSTACRAPLPDDEASRMSCGAKTGPARLPVPQEREQIRQTPRKNGNENKAVTISSYFLIRCNGNKYARPIERTATEKESSN